MHGAECFYLNHIERIVTLNGYNKWIKQHSETKAFRR